MKVCRFVSGQWDTYSRARNVKQCVRSSLGEWQPHVLTRLGTPTPSELAFAAQHYRLAIRIGKRLCPNDNYADVICFAFPALIDAARFYDADRGTVGTYASVLITQLIIRHRARMNFIVRSSGLRGINPNPILFDGKAELAEVSTPDDEPANPETLALIKQSFATLKKRHRSILSRFLGLDRPREKLELLAARYRVSKQRIHQIVKASLRKIALASNLPTRAI